MLLGQNLSQPSFLFFSFYFPITQPSQRPSLPCAWPRRGPRPSHLLLGDRTKAGEGGLVPNGINTNPNELRGYPQI
jgi:hypothetical protein